MTDTGNFGSRMKAARVKKMWSQFDLAKRADVNPSTISNLETGKQMPRAGTLARILRVLGMSYEEAMIGTDPSVDKVEEDVGDFLTRNPGAIKDPRLVKEVLRNLIAEFTEAEERRRTLSGEDEPGQTDN